MFQPIYRGADKSLAQPGRKQARKHVRDARDFNNIETRDVIKFYFLQGKAPKEIHAILTETLGCYLPGWAKNLSASLYSHYQADGENENEKDNVHSMFEMWCWRRMEKISWTDHVRNEEVLLRVKEQRNILHEIRKRKANWVGHILRRNCLLQWGYLRKDKRKYRSDRKTRKKT